MTGHPDIYKAFDYSKTPVILLTHTPDIFPKLQHPVNLVLAGHTHGGQVRLPLLGPIFTASRYGDKYCVPEIIVIEFE